MASLPVQYDWQKMFTNRFLIRSNTPRSLGDNFLIFLPDLITNKLANKIKLKLMRELMINQHHPMQNNKPVKVPHSHAVWKIQHLGWGLVANTALDYASCCICHSTLPLVLYFPYSTRSCVLTSMYVLI